RSHLCRAGSGGGGGTEPVAPQLDDDGTTAGGHRMLFAHSGARLLVTFVGVQPDPVSFDISLGRIVARCLEKQPDNRFQSAKDMAFALLQLFLLSTCC